MTTPSKHQKNTLDQLMIATLNDKLKDICRTLNPDDPPEKWMSTYTQPWTDELLADDLNKHWKRTDGTFTANNVGGFRTRAYGVLKTDSLQDGGRITLRTLETFLLGRIKILEQQIADIFDQNAAAEKVVPWCNEVDAHLKRIDERLTHLNARLDSLKPQSTPPRS